MPLQRLETFFAQRVFASNQMGSLLLSMYEKQNLLDLTRIGICESSVDQNPTMNRTQGIIGYTATDLEIAEEIAYKVKPHELYPAIDIVEREFS